MNSCIQKPIMTYIPVQLEPVKILITGGTGSIGYILNFFICQGHMFGSN